ncbi:AMP-dependent synthetase/ligase [Actinosynnema sp. NPDC020468]|uniref:AMP-dependent synthetase/ligase n=1 Tax=Actinosynnema sp. NPDC020468 TaxID=3154488 RepID=UPI0033CCF853
MLDTAVTADPNRVVLSRKTDTGWRDASYRDFTEQVRSVACGLLAHGVRHGDRVAVLGRTSYEWAVADYAAMAIGAVTVPIYPTSSEHQVKHVLADSGAAWFFAETPEDARRLTAAGATAVWLLREVHEWRVTDRKDELDARWHAVKADDLATIVYTSGTTGLPKGCMLTHRNMYVSSANTVEQTGWMLRDATPGQGQASTLLSLPLSHVFGRTILLSCLCGGTRTGLVPGVPELLEALAEFRPTWLPLVPYALEKIRKRSRGLLDADAEETAIAAGLANAGQAVELPEFAAVRESFGGRFRYVISGGASLDDTTAAFYAGIGVTILNCYGLTEAATAVTVNEPATNRMSTVGRPIPGVTIAIAEDGELLIKGGNVSPGYWPERTAGEWLATGDLGEIDADGFLRITGRRKEILVTSGGKNVAPTPLEDRVRLHPLVSNCVVIGDGRSYVTALVTLDAAALPGWAARNGVDLDDDGWREHPALLEEVGTAVDDANTLVSRAESIRRFRILPGDLTVADGLMTPSMKVRRAAVAEVFAEDIAALYDISAK